MHFEELFSLFLLKPYIQVNEGDNMTDPSALKQLTDDLKYLNRMSFRDFADILFPNATPDYLIPKWDLFTADKLSFIWSCSTDKIRLICDYIKAEMGE